MAQVHGVAGEWARIRGTVNGLMPFFASIFLFGFAMAVTIFVMVQLGALLIVLALCAGAYFLIRGEKRMESYFKGARGEEYVAGILRDLPDANHIFNDFVALGHHVDHVVVGSAGVFAIETKFWRGKVTIEDGHVLVDGQLPDRSPIEQARREAAAVREELAKRGWRGEVTPILVFASNTFEAKIAEVHGAVILNANFLRECLTTDRIVISTAELSRLTQLMENNS